MSKIYNIPLSSNFLERFISYIVSNLNILEKAKNSIIIFPNKRLQREFHNKITSIATNNFTLIPKSFAYSDMYENFFEFSDLCNQDMSEKILKYARLSIIEDVELDILIRIILKNIRNTKQFSDDLINSLGIEKIKQAISEYYYYEYSIDQIYDELNVNCELLFIEIIKRLELYFKANNFILKQQVQNKFSQVLLDTWDYDSAKNIYSIVPLNDVNYILKFLKILSKYKNAKIFIQGLDKNLSEEVWQGIDDKHNQHYLKKFLSYIDVSRDEVKNLSNQKNLDKYFSFTSCLSNNLSCLNNYDHYQLPKTIELIEGDNQSHEARLVALAIQESIDLHSEIVIVTSNKHIAKKIKYYLSEFHIKVDDFILNTSEQSSGLVLFHMILEYFSSHNNQIHLFLDILKHPLCDITDLATETILEFELKFLRKTPNKIDLQNYFNLFDKEEETRFGKVIQAYLLLEQNKKDAYISKNICSILNIHLKTLDFFLVQNDKDISWYNTLKAFKDSLSNNSLSDFRFDFQDYKEIILNFLTELRFESQTEKCKVKISEVMETRFLDYDLIFFVGMNEGIFPKHKEDHGLISKFSRERMKIRGLASESGYAEATFLNILSSNKVFLSYSKSLKTSSMKSRYLERFLLGYKLTKTRLPINTYYKELDNKIHNQKAFPINKPYINPRLNFRPSKISVSGIENLMLDPYIYYLKYILKLVPLEKVCYPVSNREFGVLTHDVLAKISNSNIDINNLSEQEISRITPENTIKKFWTYRLETIIKWLAANKLFDDNFVERQIIEAKGAMELEINNKKICVTAIADRIDYTKDNTVRIIDYKTGYVPKLKEIKYGLYPQLPIEELILRNGKFTSFLVDNNDYKVGLIYLKLSGKRDKPCEKIIVKVDQNDAYQSLIQLLENFLCKENDYFPASNTNVKNIAYSHLTRLDEWVFN